MHTFRVHFEIDGERLSSVCQAANPRKAKEHVSERNPGKVIIWLKIKKLSLETV